MDFILVPYGIVFQEYHKVRSLRSGHRGKRFSGLALAWTLVSFLVTSAFVGNLKAIFVVKTYEDSIDTIAQMMDR